MFDVRWTPGRFRIHDERRRTGTPGERNCDLFRSMGIISTPVCDCYLADTAFDGRLT